jgi:hypothetical protein
LNNKVKHIIVPARHPCHVHWGHSLKYHFPLLVILLRWVPGALSTQNEAGVLPGLSFYDTDSP